MDSYTIQKGDNLSTLAKTYKTDVGTLAKLNNISNVNLIKQGQVLKLPSITGSTQAVPSSQNNVTIPTVIDSSSMNPSETPKIPTANPKGTLTVVNQKDNNDGTTTNFLSDGSKSTVRYTKNPDGSLTPTEVPYNAADEIIRASQVEDTAAQKTATDLSTSIFNLVPKLQGESATRTEEFAKAGVGNLKQELQSINSQILKKQAEIAQDDVKLVATMRSEERRDTLLPFAQSNQAKLAGDAAIMRALKTSEIGVLNATAIAKQGDIELAKETAEEAVAAKYAPYKELIGLYQAQLTALAPILTKDEKKQATEQTIRSNVALKEIEQKQKNDSDIATMIINATAQQAPASVITKAKNAAKTGDKVAVAEALGVYSGDALDRAIKLKTLDKLGLEVAQKRAELDEANAGGTKTLSYEELAKFNSTPEAKTIKDGTRYAQSLRDYKAAIDKWGSGEVLSAKGKGELNSAYISLVGSIKDYYTLGTLDAGVQKLVGLGINEPSVWARDKKVTSALDLQMKQATENINRSSLQLMSTKYKNSAELKNLIDGALEVTSGITALPNNEFLNLVPGSEMNSQNMPVLESNASFFNNLTPTQ